MEPRRKNKISNFGTISPLYPNFIYHPLSLSQFEEKQKSRKDIYIRGLSIYYLFWHFESVSLCTVKDSCIFMLPRGRSLFFAVLLWICYFMLPFQLLFALCYLASIRLMLSCLLIPLKYHTGNRSCRLLQHNIITTKTYRSIFFHYLGEEV